MEDRLVDPVRNHVLTVPKQGYVLRCHAASVSERTTEASALDMT